jgi:methionine-rich copper-binding protein CopC
MRRLHPLFGASLAVLLLAAAATDVVAVRHFQLVKSETGEASMLEQAPTSIRLWFSQVPQMGGARIRVIDPEGEPVRMGPVEQDDEDPKLVHASIEGSFAAGQSKVVWRAMAADGHVVTGEFTFTIRAADPTRR